MTLDLEVNEVEVKGLTSLASVTEITADETSTYINLQAARPTPTKSTGCVDLYSSKSTSYAGLHPPKSTGYTGLCCQGLTEGQGISLNRK